ncbi:unnamed protein product [Schistosoma margrebowiei]|uniref:Uncharacterized protein n=1 Tax=Schistosoma margrebowiei TaxID=48269 RepID=A0A183MEN5_9TREM|nr:unnamed protein product [Schistosoma margrebowiei]
MSVKVDIQSSNFCHINDESVQHEQLIPEDTISTVYRSLRPCTPLVWNQGFPTPLGGLSMSTNPVEALDVRILSSQFRKQHPRHEKTVDEQPNVNLDDNEKLANDSNDSLHEVLDDLNKFNDELKKPFNDSFSTDLSNLPYPPGYSIVKQNDSVIN